MRVIVSTDSEEFAAIARSYGAEVPFLRPAEISQDLSIDEEFAQHALNWLKENEGYKPDVLVHLRATYPTRSVETLDACIETFLEARTKGYTSLRTIVPAEKTPFKMYRMYGDLSGGTANIEPLFRTLDEIHEPFNNCRQALPKTYVHNCCIDIVNTDTIMGGSMSGLKLYPFLMDSADFFDIDTPEDWVAAEGYMIKKHAKH
jgi:CMP-N-acetylneuraminic acid synthetase